MIRKTFLRNFKLVVLIALVICPIIYAMADKPEDITAENEVVSAEASFIPEEPVMTIEDSIVDYALSFLGTPYVTAGSGKEGFDCSGFIYFVFQHFELEVPRSTAGYTNFGTEIPVEEVQEGDLLLFLSPTRNAIGHIGLVTGANGKDSDFIHATSGPEMSVVITNLSDKGYTRRFVKAIRVL